MKKTIEMNEGKHARQKDTDFVTVITAEKKTAKATKAERRKTRFVLVESIRILVITLFLFATQSMAGVFFPLVFLLIVSGLLSVLEYEADDLE